MKNPRPLLGLVTAGATVAGGVVALSIFGSATIKFIQSAMETKRKNSGKPCQTCRAKGFYMCKLCKGNATIEWSPLFDPFYINPCQCPTCEGNRIQRCLNCLGKGYF